MLGKLSTEAIASEPEAGADDGEPAPLGGPDWHKFHRGYEAVNRGEVDGVLELLDPRIEWDMSRSFPDGPVYHGHVGVRQFFADAAKLWEDFALEIDELHDADNEIVIIGWWSGTGRASGVPIRSPGAWVYRMRGGRAVRMRFYRDRDDALASVEVARGR